MIPEPGDIWQYIHPNRDDNGVTVLIHEFLNETHNLAQKKVLVYWGYDLLNDQYDEWLFSEDSFNKNYWRKIG